MEEFYCVGERSFHNEHLFHFEVNDNEKTSVNTALQELLENSCDSHFWLSYLKALKTELSEKKLPFFCYQLGNGFRSSFAKLKSGELRWGNRAYCSVILRYTVQTMRRIKRRSKVKSYF